MASIQLISLLTFFFLVIKKASPSPIKKVVIATGNLTPAEDRDFSKLEEFFDYFKSKKLPKPTGPFGWYGGSKFHCPFVIGPYYDLGIENKKCYNGPYGPYETTQRPPPPPPKTTVLPTPPPPKIEYVIDDLDGADGAEEEEEEYEYKPRKRCRCKNCRCRKCRHRNRDELALK